jgi:glycolate oxidase iron-sulfur subunit
VRYGRLLDIAREVVEKNVPRPLGQRLARRTLRVVVSHRRRFTALLRVGQALRGFLPGALRSRIPQRRPAGAWPDRAHARTMLVWPGCVQPALAPDINAAAARVLDRFGIRLIAADTGCCGALSYHLAAPEEARAFMRRNIDACWPQIEAGAEAIVMTTSGCGAHVRDYGYLLHDDPKYRDKAKRFSEMIRDIAEVVTEEWQDDLPPASPATDSGRPRGPRIAFQSPCSLQHGVKLNGLVEKLLRRAGFTLAPVAYAFMCCGAAGSYSILQPALAQALRARKLETLLACRPQAVATANIGCLTHLAAESPVPVRHWIEMLDEALKEKVASA